MTAIRHKNTYDERGAAMLVALVLLVAVTLTALFTNRNLVFGVKSQANQANAVMAHEAAMGGLETAFAVLARSENRKKLLWTTLPTNPADPSTGVKPSAGNWYDGRIFGFFRSDGTFNLQVMDADNATNPALPAGTVSSFQVRIKRLNTPAGLDPDQAVRLEVLGCADGQAPNATAGACAAQAVITQSTILKPALASAPAAALTAKGNVTLSGNVQITNTDPATNGTTVHSGGTVSGLGSADLVTLPGTPDGASIAPNDNTLANLTDDQYFEGFFGQSKDSMKADALQISCSGSACGGAIKTNEGAGKVIWVTTTDAQINASGTSSQIGTADAPVILIVDGPLQINGNVTIYGLVYCANITWNNTGGGTSQIIGAAIAEGSFNATGTPNPTYDPNVLKKLKQDLGAYTRIGGGWKDWCTDCNFAAW